MVRRRYTQLHLDVLKGSRLGTVKYSYYKRSLSLNHLHIRRQEKNSDKGQ